MQQYPVPAGVRTEHSPGDLCRLIESVALGVDVPVEDLIAAAPRDHAPEPAPGVPPGPGEFHSAPLAVQLAYCHALQDPVAKAAIDARDQAAHDRIVTNTADKQRHVAREKATIERLRRVIRRRAAVLRASAPDDVSRIFDAWCPPVAPAAAGRTRAGHGAQAGHRRRRHVARATSSSDPGDDGEGDEPAGPGGLPAPRPNGGAS